LACASAGSRNHRFDYGQRHRVEREAREAHAIRLAQRVVPEFEILIPSFAARTISAAMRSQ